VQDAASFLRACEMNSHISKHGVPQAGSMYSAAAPCGASAEQLRFLHASCASVQSSTASSLADKLGSEAAATLAQRASWAAFYACAAHPSELLCSQERTHDSVCDIVAELLPVTGLQGQQQPQQEDLLIEAFQAGDVLACYYKRSGTTSNGSVESLAAALANAVTPSSTPAGAVTITPSVDGTAAMHATATENRSPVSAETRTQEQHTSTALGSQPGSLSEGYYPISVAAFAQLQSLLAAPCTVDSYATAETAVCSNFVCPGGDVFSSSNTS
jgi:hypothetical protein